MPDFQKSPELEAIARRWMRALMSRGGRAMSNMLSASDPLLFCGSADGEIWEGAFFRNSYAEHIDETLAACGRFECVERREHDGSRPLDRPQTKFERRGLELGHRITDWQFDRME